VNNGRFIKFSTVRIYWDIIKNGTFNINVRRCCFIPSDVQSTKKGEIINE